MQTTPVTLLQKLRANADESAWARFVDIFAPLVFQWARRYGLQQADAEETVQDVFLALWRRMRSFEYDANGSFRAWLATVTRHEALRRLKRASPGELAEEPIAAAEEPEFDRREYAAWVMQRATRIIERDFEPATWRAFQAYVLDDRPAADVAGELGITRNAVYLCCNRVLARLRQEVAGLLD
jgi:RNA polymerase sigma-70 factor (ECF subfamily)